MSDYRRIMVSLPDSLLTEIDNLLSWGERRDRSEFVREALWNYVEEQRKRTIREQLKQGYMEMGSLNLQLAEEGLEADEVLF